MTVLPGAALLKLAEAYGGGDEDRAGDVALALVETNPGTWQEAVQVAERTAHRSRMRSARRSERDRALVERIGPVPEPDPEVVAWCGVLIETLRFWCVANGRMPSRTTIWRLLREAVKQNGV